LTTVEIKEKILNDAVFIGLRSVIGIIFVVHGMLKFDPEFASYLPMM